MLETDTIDGTDIVTVAYSGSVATEEMDQLRTTAREVIDREGGVRLLLEFGDVDLGRIEPKAWVEDLKMTGLLGDIEKMALVSDTDWIGSSARLLGALMSGEARSFPAGERDEALVWLRA